MILSLALLTLGVQNLATRYGYAWISDLMLWTFAVLTALAVVQAL